MPSNLLTVKDTFTNYKKVFLSTGNGYRRGGTFDALQVTADSQGRKVVQAGTVIVRPTIPGSVRSLRRSKALSTVTTGGTISVSNPEVYTAGNVLSIIAPAGRVQLGGTYANGETLTLQLDGVSYVHTVANFSNLTALAEAAVLAFNSTASFNAKAIALAENGYIHVYARDMKTNYAFGASEAAASGTVAVLNSATALLPGLAIGTIASINVDTGAITLGAGSSNRLPVGMPFGVATALEPLKVLGLTEIPYDVVTDSNDIVVCSDGTLNLSAVPYMDEQILSMLPRIAVA